MVQKQNIRIEAKERIAQCKNTEALTIVKQWFDYEECRLK